MTTPPASDQERLRAEYSRREDRFHLSDQYSLFNPANLYRVQSLERKLLARLRNLGYFPLNRFQLLEIGCGGGGVMLDYYRYGCPVSQAFGIDLLPNRVAYARQRLPVINVACADGQQLPFASQSFDLTLQYTVFSSILDPTIKQNLGREIIRVTRLGGLILWYDFWLNPTNPQTRGIRPAEIRALFPGCTYEFHKITLAPPLARRLAPLSWLLTGFLEKLTLFNTHFLAIIRPAAK